MLTRTQPDPTSALDAKDILTALLHQGTPVHFKAGGYSMTPSIHNGETVRIHPLHPTDIQRGAILLYKINNRLVLHRLVDRDRKTQSLLFIGDAALKGSDRINERDLLGVAVCVHRGKRTLPLNTRRTRKAGILRYRLRPLRRLIRSHQHIVTD